MSNHSPLFLFLFVCIPVRVALAVGAKLVVDHDNRVGVVIYGATAAVMATGFLIADIAHKDHGLLGFPRFWISLPHAIFHIMFAAFILSENQWAYTLLLFDVAYSVVFYSYHKLVRKT